MIKRRYGTSKVRFEDVRKERLRTEGMEKSDDDGDEAAFSM